LIISVHGGIANFGLQPKLKQAIENGLIKVANTSHIWIITAGTDTGVVKHIGDILRTYYPKARNNIFVFGIAPWGVVNDRDSLIGCEIEVPYYSNPGMINSGKGFNLNNCHSYFLFVDDGTIGRYGCEISFRRRLERFISRYKSEVYIDFDLRPKFLDVTFKEKTTLHNHPTIPLVSLVIEGGTNTIQTVLVNVHDEPPVPVVICDGSGRAADLISFAYKYITVNPNNKKAVIDPDVQEQLIITIMKTFSYNKRQANYIFIQLMKCSMKKDLISIYRLGDDAIQEIDLAILTASLKVIDIELSKQLDIIMSWNRTDIAKQYILLHGTNEEKRILEDKMFDAIAQDKVDFVKLLLEYGVNLKEFLTFKRLQDLYNCVRRNRFENSSVLFFYFNFCLEKRIISYTFNVNKRSC
jgi:transient receptor potential cation channel subfamily M member 3